MAELTRILIVEDHTMLAEALSLSLSARGFECSVADLGSPEGVLAQAARSRPAAVLLDLDLGVADGVDLVAGLQALGASVLVVTGHTAPERLAETIYLGAVGWVSKAEPFERLVDAAQRAARGTSTLSASSYCQLKEAGGALLSAEQQLKRDVAQLTLREREVLEGLEAGKSAEEIAGDLVVSLGTVRTHIRGVLTKLNVSSQLAAVAKVRQLGGAPARAPARAVAAAQGR